MSLSAYFHSRQYIPYDRMGEMFRDIFGVHISAGSLVNLVDGFAKNARKLKQKLLRGDYLRPMEKRTILEERFYELLNWEIDASHEKALTFRNRMNCYREHLFLFLHRWDVPPDNNGSERAVRTFKVKQKISGLFRSLDDAQTFAVIRSVIDTSIKNEQNVFQTLALMAKG
jgi:transposase